MAKTTLVQITYTEQHLLEEMATLGQGERTMVCDIVEQLSSRYELLRDVGNLNLPPIFLDHSGRLFEVMIFDDILVVQLLCG